MSRAWRRLLRDGSPVWARLCFNTKVTPNEPVIAAALRAAGGALRCIGRLGKQPLVNGWPRNTGLPLKLLRTQLSAAMLGQLTEVCVARRSLGRPPDEDNVLTFLDLCPSLRTLETDLALQFNHFTGEVATEAEQRIISSLPRLRLRRLAMNWNTVAPPVLTRADVQALLAASQEVELECNELTAEYLTALLAFRL